MYFAMNVCEVYSKHCSVYKLIYFTVSVSHLSFHKSRVLSWIVWSKIQFKHLSRPFSMLINTEQYLGWAKGQSNYIMKLEYYKWNKQIAISNLQTTCKHCSGVLCFICYPRTVTDQIYIKGSLSPQGHALRYTMTLGKNEHAEEYLGKP